MFVLLGFVVWGIWNSFSNSQSLNTQFCLMYSSFPVLLEHRTIEEGRPLWKTKLLIAENEELRKNSSTNCNKVFYLSFRWASTAWLFAELVTKHPCSVHFLVLIYMGVEWNWKTYNSVWALLRAQIK